VIYRFVACRAGSGQLNLGGHHVGHHGWRIVVGQRLMQAASDRAVADFSSAYADQNERDFEAFSAAVGSGRLTAQTGL
jgi:hypothetical protein